jgi:hypothetical protein
MHISIPFHSVNFPFLPRELISGMTTISLCFCPLSPTGEEREGGCGEKRSLNWQGRKGGRGGYLKRRVREEGMRRGLRVWLSIFLPVLFPSSPPYPSQKFTSPTPPLLQPPSWLSRAYALRIWRNGKERREKCHGA